MTNLIIRPAAPGDRGGWEPLYLGYGDFYKVAMISVERGGVAGDRVGLDPRSGP